GARQICHHAVETREPENEIELEVEEKEADIQATGALIKYLEEQTDSDSDRKMAFPIIGFKNINMCLKKSALQIFKRDFRSQATVDNKIVTKEGIMNHTRSQVGFRMLKQWFLQPLADFRKIVERQEAVSLLKNPKHEMTINSIRNHIRQLKPASKLSQKIKCSTLTASDWSQLQKAQQIQYKVRHILQEVKVQQIIPNDTILEDKKLMIITGPNASGKSIYIKQVGLIVYLAHIGSFVPAKSAEIGVFDSIYTRIMSTESVGSSSSSFLSDLNQILPTLTCFSNRSLILIDEFGKGTHFVNENKIKIIQFSKKHRSFIHINW
ncbi:hypothetical protein MXB_3602, partial [Myxobolus squamalis]